MWEQFKGGKNLRKYNTCTMYMCHLNYPCACARGKVIGLYVCCCLHENRHFGISTFCRHLNNSKASRSVGIGKKTMLQIVHEHHQQRLLVGHHSHTHEPCPPQVMCFPHMCTTGRVEIVNKFNTVHAL